MLKGKFFLIYLLVSWMILTWSLIWIRTVRRIITYGSVSRKSPNKYGSFGSGSEHRNKRIRYILFEFTWYLFSFRNIFEASFCIGAAETEIDRQIERFIFITVIIIICYVPVLVLQTHVVDPWQLRLFFGYFLELHLSSKIKRHKEEEATKQ